MSGRAYVVDLLLGNLERLATEEHREAAAILRATIVEHLELAFADVHGHAFDQGYEAGQAAAVNAQRQADEQTRGLGCVALAEVFAAPRTLH